MYALFILKTVCAAQHCSPSLSPTISATSLQCTQQRDKWKGGLWQAVSFRKETVLSFCLCEKWHRQCRSKYCQYASRPKYLDKVLTCALFDYQRVSVIGAVLPSQLNLILPAKQHISIQHLTLDSQYGRFDYFSHSNQIFTSLSCACIGADWVRVRVSMLALHLFNTILQRHNIEPVISSISHYNFWMFSTKNLTNCCFKILEPGPL